MRSPGLLYRYSTFEGTTKKAITMKFLCLPLLVHVSGYAKSFRPGLVDSEFFLISSVSIINRTWLTDLLMRYFVSFKRKKMLEPGIFKSSTGYRFPMTIASHSSLIFRYT